MRLLIFILLISFGAQAQPYPVKRPKPNKITAVPVIITPAAPTNFIVNDVLNTATITLTPGYGTTDHEVSINSGASYNTLTSLPVMGLTGNYAIGSIRFRVKAATGRNASAYVSNGTAYTEDEEEENGTVINMASVYGITGGTGVDNTDELMDFNSDYQSEDNLLILDFRSLGAVEIRYSDPTWLFGIDSVKVWGNGCTFRCTSTSDWDSQRMAFSVGGMFHLSRYPGGGSYNTGYKFNTVAAGSSTITLNEAGWSLTAGDRVYIAGYEEQGYGEPFNPRFFEWKTVASVAGSVITFTTPIRWRYDADWKDISMPMNGGTNFGKPRLFKLPADYIRYAEFVNCIMGKGTSVPGGESNKFLFTAQTFICDSVTIGEDQPTESEVAIRRNCTITEGGDLDKNIGLLKYENCTVTGLSGATGVDSLVFIDNSFSSYCPLAPRVLYVEGNTFTTSAQHNIYKHPEVTGFENIILKDNTFTHTGGATANTPHVLFYTNTFTTTTGTNSSQLIVADPGSYNPANSNFKAVKGVTFGSTVTYSGGSAIVTNITHNGTNFVFHLSSVSGSPASGQTWSYYDVKELDNLGGNISTNGYAIYDILP